MSLNIRYISKIKVGGGSVQDLIFCSQVGQRGAGFTLIEILVVIAIIALVSSLMIFAFTGLESVQALEQEVGTVRGFLEEARVYTQGSRSASSYGVWFEEEGVTLFRGESWAERDEILQDRRFDQSVIISLIDLNDGGSEVVFERLFGEPHTWGEIRLWSTSEEADRRVIIHPSGLVE